MESLENLPNIEKLSDRVIRVLGLNPGQFTLQGTNTYIIGTGNQRLLLDTGEGRDGYLTLVKEVLGDKITLTDIVISHWHHDHIGGILDLWREYPDVRFHKFPSAQNDSKVIPHEFTGTIRHIKDGDVIKIEGATLKVVHAPGHTDDHLILFLQEEDSLFSADCVLGEGTGVFENLSQYMASLRKALDLHPKRIYPGHGSIVSDGVAKINEYIAHRQQREDQVVELLKSRKQPNGWTARELVEIIYAQYPESIWPAAEHGVLLILEKSKDELKVHKHSTAGQEIWQWMGGSQL